MSWRQAAKLAAATRAVEHVKDGAVVGLGSGSTAALAVRQIGKRIREEGLRVYGVPSSHQAHALAVREGIKIVTLDEHPQLDIAVDGADQVDARLSLIKGGGGAFVRERIVASAAKLYIIAVDSSKLCRKLNNVAVPVEVLPFAVTPVCRALASICTRLEVREAARKVGPVVTDNGNFIVDMHVERLDNPARFHGEVKKIPGVVDTGIFLNMADIVYVGNPDGSVSKLTRKK